MTPGDAHAALVTLLHERRGRGLDLRSLLDLRHLSRLYSLRCREPASIAQAVELESRAAELYAESRNAAPEFTFLERRIAKLLGQMQAAIERVR